MGFVSDFICRNTSKGWSICLKPQVVLQVNVSLVFRRPSSALWPLTSTVLPLFAVFGADSSNCVRELEDVESCTKCSDP